MKRIYNLGILLLVSCYMQAQIPNIQSFSPRSTTVDDIVSIIGTGFGSNQSAIKVYFGAASATVVKANDTQIKVMVPPGATHDNITVINTSSGLTSTSKEQFLLSFEGSGLSAANFDPQVDFSAISGVYDHCLADFDLDGNVDVAVAHYQSNFVSVFRNNSTLTTLLYTKKDIDMGSFTNNLTSGDIDGDGKLDLIASKYSSSTIGDKIFVLRNNSTPGNIVFDPLKEFTVTGSTAKAIVVQDLDADGKAEIIVSNEANNLITILKNESSIGIVAFNSKIINVVGIEDSRLFLSSFAINDLNGDKLPDLIVTGYLKPNIYIIPNISAKGYISFGTPKMIPVPGSLIKVVVGDFNGDTRQDIAATNYNNNAISIIVNKTATIGGDIVFNDIPKEFAVTPSPWGIDIGDLDGDGKPDIASVSIALNRTISILRNTSLNGTLSFAPKLDLAISNFGRNLKIGDLNGDGKPDISIISIGSEKLSIIRNKHCIIPTVKPKGPVTFCPPQSAYLRATRGRGITYQWQKGGVNIPGATDFYINVSPSVQEDYKVILTGEAGNCSNSSNTIAVKPGAGVVPTKPVASNNGPVCEEEILNLSATKITGATYQWTGPNGFTSTDQNPVLINVNPSMAGNYIVNVKLGECLSTFDTTTAVLKPSVPVDNIVASVAAICEGGNTELRVSNVPGYLYQWQKDAVNIPGANSYNYIATSEGRYTVATTSTLGCKFISKEISLLKTSKFVASFNAPDYNCTSQYVKLTNTTTGLDASSTYDYLWDFGNGITTTEKDPILKRPFYGKEGKYTIKLKVSIRNSCVSEFSKIITISNNAIITIFSGTASNVLCNGEPAILTGPEDYSTYKWFRYVGNTPQAIAGATGATLPIEEGGKYSLEATRDGGCKATGAITVSFIDKPILTIATQPELTPTLHTGDTLQLNVDLNFHGGTPNGNYKYKWEPNDGLSDPNIPNPKAFPKRTTTYTVTAKTDSICEISSSIQVKVIEGINVTPNNVITPNDDAKNDTWQIANIESYKDCKVIVFNRQGQKVYEALPYNNDWDGTWNGKKLPEGAYFYVIQCNESGKGKAGSLTLIR